MKESPIWSLRRLADSIEIRIGNKRDSNTIISGRTGVGKSHLAHVFLNKFEGFNINKHLTYRRDEMIDMIINQKKGYIWNDEFISSSFKRGFFEKAQIKLISTLTTYRFHGNIVVACIPNFYSMDVELRKLFSLHIFVVERGLAVVHAPIKEALFGQDSWDTKENSKLESKWNAKKRKNPDFKIPYHELSTFVGYLKFPKLTDKQEEYYEKLKVEKRTEFDDEKKENNSEENFYENALEMIKSGTLDEKSLLPICLSHNKKLSSVRARLGQILRDEGKGQTLKDFFKLKAENNKNPVLKDNLIKDISDLSV